MDNKNFIVILEQFYRITNKINKMRNTPLSFDGTELLNTAAIHLIDIIGKHQGYNLTEIADTLGITKGAVSQMTSKLESKNLIMKQKGETNDKDVYFSLTEEGMRVYQGHEKLHEGLYTRIEEIFSQFSNEDIDKIKTALNEIDICMTEYKHI